VLVPRLGMAALGQYRLFDDPSEEPPVWLKRFFTSLRYTLKEINEVIVLIGMILITALAVYALWQGHQSSLHPFQPRQIEEPTKEPVKGGFFVEIGFVK
jgi:hypothetical protein